MTKVAKVGHSNTLVQKSSPSGIGGSLAIPGIEDLPDVDLSTPPDDGDVLIWDAGSETWVPGPQGAGAGPIADDAVWMPLTTVVAGEPVLVWDADNSLIPTLTPI